MGFRGGAALVTAAVTALALAGCSSSSSTGDKLDSTMHRIASASDRDHVTSLSTLSARLQSSDAAQGAQVAVVDSHFLATPTPGSQKTWATVLVRLTDPYLSGAFGKQTSATACYDLEFTYYGLHRQRRTACP